MEEWKTYKVEDLIEEIAMGPFGSNIKVECFKDSGIPVLNGSNLYGFKLNEESFNYVSEEKADSLGHSNAYRGDVVITHRGTLGQIVYIPLDSKFQRYVISQSQFRLKLDRSKVLPEFFVYFFHTRIGQHRLLSNASQVGVPAIARPTSTFRKVEIELPSPSVQQRIVKLLDSIGDKIELNNRINHNLEEQAQVLFDEIFINNTSELGKSTKAYLTDIATYLNGLAMQKYPASGLGLPVLKIKELGQGLCDASSDRCSADIKEDYIVKDGDCIFSWSGTLMIDLWCGGLCGLNQHLFKVSSDTYPKWFYYMWTKHYMDTFIRIAKDKAVTMGHIKRSELEKAEVLIPCKAKMNELDAFFSPILSQIVKLRQQNRVLSSQRDKILPKLMTGELNIKEIDC